jgi:hypothetical protein
VDVRPCMKACEASAHTQIVPNQMPVIKLSLTEYPNVVARPGLIDFRIDAARQPRVRQDGSGMTNCLCSSRDGATRE